MAAIAQDKFTITQADPNVASSTATAAKMTEIYKFTCPRGTELKIQPHDEISMYLKDAVAESLNTDSFELAVEDANRLTKKIIASGIYLEAKEFQDHNKTKKIGATHYVRAEQLIVLYVKCATVTVTASCYFKLTSTRRYQTLS